MDGKCYHIYSIHGFYGIFSVGQHRNSPNPLGSNSIFGLAAFNRNSFRQFFQLQVQRGHTLTAAAGKEAWSTGCLE
jgi:hypothetical protein